MIPQITRHLHARLHAYWGSFSFVGLIIATLFFSGSVTPSLLPRTYLVQGILSGFALAIGYMVGVGAVWFWKFLELPLPEGPYVRRAKQVTVAAVVAVFGSFTWRATEWQNSIRELMELPELESAEAIWFFLIALVVATILVGIARAIILVGMKLSLLLQRYLPRRMAISLSTITVFFVALFIGNGVVIRGLLSAADSFFLNADRLIDDGIAQPTESWACGSAGSLVDWDSIGRQGKNFIMGGPTLDELNEFAGDEPDVVTPIRVYVGMNSGADDEARAALAVEELQRAGGFERKVLVVATPTGTGWLDQGATDTLEYLHHGDTAIVSMQYSYLPSWMTILVDPSRSQRSAAALFNRVYAHWTGMPKDSRPQLFMFGLSLGSLGCEDAADLIETFQDPIGGAVLSGPPFPSRQWASIVSSRNSGTPVWLPTFRDESMFRFTTQRNYLDTGKPWGPIRYVYIQYASDPMIWFSPSLAWHRPAWLSEPRGPDVTAALRWYPIVTFLKVAFDLPMATSVPTGYGHNYAPANYIDAWVAVTQPSSWSSEDLQRLKSLFAPPVTASAER